MKRIIQLFSLLLCFAPSYQLLTISNEKLLQLNTIIDQKIAKPTSVTELQEIVSTAQGHGVKISIAGMRQSQGGQTTYEGALLVDLTSLNKVMMLDLENKKVTVQAGITWDQLQEILNPLGLAVTGMQSYATFSVGGALSVNAHGQDLRYAPLIRSVDSVKVLLANGQLVNASPHENPELFYLVIGGYGLFGIVVEVTLSITDNIELVRRSEIIDTKDYHTVFEKIKSNPNSQLHSIRLSTNPYALFEKSLVITYDSTNQKSFDSLQDINRTTVSLGMNLFYLINKYQFIKPLRFFFEKNISEREGTFSRNNAMRFSAQKVMRSDAQQTDILQEYFIPYNNVLPFIELLKNVVQKYEINLLNVTLRWVPADNQTVLAYAPTDSCAFVIYATIEKNASGVEKTKGWTRELIDHALSLQGTFYLPYQLFASKEQVRKAYPRFEDVLALKNVYDPQQTFMNHLYAAYA